MRLSSTGNDQQPASPADGIRVLLLDTPENEGVDFLQSLQRQGMQFISERVHGEKPLLDALKSACWDILLVNDRIESPGTDDILSAFRQLQSDTGLVVLSNSPVTVESLLEAYRKGVSDVVSSHHPEYSAEVFSRAAERSRRNLQLSQLNQEKFELTRHRDQLMSGTEEALAYLQDGLHVYANDAYLAMLGYRELADLAVLPFIDIVSSELRDKIKQQLLDYQHKVRMKPESQAMAIEEMFVSGAGEKAGIMQVHATFKAVVYDGQDCLQVVLRDRSADAARDGAGTMEGLGYPLFVSHLDNFIADARASGKPAGHVIHIAGKGLEHYIAAKGYGSLNGKLKVLFSELKADLETDDFMIRFTDNSLLILLKGDEPQDAQKIARQSRVLETFSGSLNSEIADTDAGAVVTFSQEIIPVVADAESAEQLIRSFLMGKPVVPEKIAGKDDPKPSDNVVPFSKSAQAGGDGARKQPEKPGKPVAREIRETARNKTAKPAQQDKPAAKAQAVATPATGHAGTVQANAAISQDDLNRVLGGKGLLALYYEPVISVTDIETDFYDLTVYETTGETPLSRKHLGPELGQNPLAGKLDLWALQYAIEVIAALYDQGQEYRIRLPLSARSLAEKRLGDDLKKLLSGSGLPPGMLIVDFTVQDLFRDKAQSVRQLQALKEAGARICVSGVGSLQDFQQLSEIDAISMVVLDAGLVTGAVGNDAAFAALGGIVEALHLNKLKVCAAAVDSSELLSVCCKARLDLVQGSHIQKAPTQLSAESLAQAIAI